MKKCPKCGNEYGDNIKFCQVDGTLLVEQSQTKKCPECGAENPASANFCNNCGKKFGSDVFKCKKCGREHEQKVNFCNDCGGEVEEEGAVTEKGDSNSPEQKKLSVDMVYVEGGSMWLGKDDDEYDEDDDEYEEEDEDEYEEEDEDEDDNEENDNPEHKVILDSFYISKYQVTQELWNSVMNYDNSYYIGRKRPVDSVSWYDAVEFCNKLSKKDGLTPCYKIDKNKKDPNNENDDEDDELKWTVKCNFMANGYRLSTEAEWEYAARGGQESRGYKYAGSDDIDEVAWYSDNSDDETHNVGEKKPNELGIYDMSGNVWEWCWDWYDENIGGGTNPTGASSGSDRVIRGGDYFGDIEYSVSYRVTDTPSNSNYNGFRVVRSC